MPTLGVNIDHIANIRQARKTIEPDPVRMALLAELGGADGITIHLREDRRHIQDRDLKLLKETLGTKLNLEMAATKEMYKIAIETSPDMVTLVPERREEITTEGGLNIENNKKYLSELIKALKDKGICVSLFIDSIPKQIELSSEIGSQFIELHTGVYAESKWAEKSSELAKIEEGIFQANNLGLRVNAGHGLTYQNVEPIAALKNIEELNIGHTIIARSVAVGLKEAVSEMKNIITNARKDILK